MKVKNSWTTNPPIEVRTEWLLDGSSCEHIEERIERLERIVAALIDELRLTDEQKQKIFKYHIGPYEFVEDET